VQEHRRQQLEPPEARPLGRQEPALEADLVLAWPVFDLQLHIFFYRLICRELVDWLLIYSIPEPLPPIGCSIALNRPDFILFFAVNVVSV
jgi:hypothetical protein